MMEDGATFMMELKKFHNEMLGRCATKDKRMVEGMK
jgi:hypothetical protein